jgi:alpha-beta hydrolase superfamily lysophospholipase
MTINKRKIFKWLKIAAIIYICGGVALYFLQEKFLLHPQKLKSDHVFKFDLPFKEINLPVTDKKNLSVVRFLVVDSLRKGVVLYFHGNRRNIERYAPYARNFTKNNYEVWMIDYPGFGKSTGKLNEEILYRDAAEFYKMARAVCSPDSIIIYGKSLGTGIASQLATRVDCKRLILETPYYSMESLMRHYAFIYPVGLMAKYKFPVNEYLQRIRVPITLIHGNNDQIIPYKQSERLKAEAKNGVELITIEDGRHNDLNDFRLFHEKLNSILSQ